jgi:CheY-like chemotaxis protein
MNSPSRKILLVEDDHQVRFLFSELLQFEGYEVVEAVDGVQALEMVRNSTPFGLVVLDYSLPNMDASEFVKIFRTLSGGVAPILLVSGWDNLAERAAELRVESYIQKPSDLDELMLLVQKHVPAPSANPPQGQAHELNLH